MPYDRLLYPEFRDQFADTNYPFGDACRLTSRTGHVLPRAAFLDAVLYVPGSKGGYRVESVVVDSSKARINFSDAASRQIAYCDFAFESTSDTLTVRSATEAVSGCLVVDPVQLLSVRGFGVGTHAFAAGQADFVPAVSVPSPYPGLEAFELPGGERISGDVYLVGTDGVVVSLNDGAIRFDAVGDPLFRRRLCGDVGLFSPPTFVKSIVVNGQIEITPDDFGRIFIVSDTRTPNSVLRLIPSESGLHVELVGQEAIP